MNASDKDLFKPLSAKVGRKEYAAGGRDKKARRGGDGRKWQAFLRRREKDAERQLKGVKA